MSRKDPLSLSDHLTVSSLLAQRATKNRLSHEARGSDKVIHARRTGQKKADQESGLQNKSAGPCVTFHTARPHLRVVCPAGCKTQHAHNRTCFSERSRCPRDASQSIVRLSRVSEVWSACDTVAYRRRFSGSRTYNSDPRSSACSVSIYPA